MKYTVELCFWNPEICQVTVDADNLEEACVKAIEASDEEYGNGGGRTCYDACTETKVSMIAEGEDVELYGVGVTTLPIPKAYADPIMTEVGA